MARVLLAAPPTVIAGAVLVCLGASGCGEVLGIERWDAEPGVGGAVGSSSAADPSQGAGGAAPSATGPSAGVGGAGDGGGQGGSGAATTGGGGGGGGAGGCDLGTTEHCGACGRSCWGGACTDGACGAVRIAPEATGDPLLAVQGDRLAWFDGADRLRAATKGGDGTSALLGAATDVNSIAIGVIGGGDLAAFYTTSSQVWRQPLDGADPLPLLDVGATQTELGWTPYPQGVFVSGGYALWFEQNLSSSGGGVWRSPWNATAVPSRWCASSDVDELAVGGPHAFIVRRETTKRRLLRCSGGGPEPWFGGDTTTYPHELAVEPDGSVAYVSTFATNDPPAPARIHRVTGPGASAIVVDLGVGHGVGGQLVEGGASLYWLASSGELLSSAKTTGSVVLPVLRDEAPIPSVRALAADAEGVYWSDAQGVWAMRRDAP